MIYIIKWLPTPSELDPVPQPQFSRPFNNAQDALDWTDDHLAGREDVEYWDFLERAPEEVSPEDKDWIEDLVTRQVIEEFSQRTFVHPSRDAAQRTVERKVRAGMRGLGLEPQAFCSGDDCT